MALTLTKRETAEILRKRGSKDRQKLNGPKLSARPKQPVVDDGSAYMSWLHHDIPCIACLKLGRLHLVADGQVAPNRIEAAHQKLQLADRGFHKRAGRRGPHWTCVPLCAGHHREGPLCCDPAQAKFWAIVGFEPETLADFIEALNAAFRDGMPGAGVVQRFAAMARAA
jgi:hypothetical protein